jgi:CheY-like chemotaxis protein
MHVQDLLETEGATSFAFAVSEAEAIQSALEVRPAVITSDVKLVSGTGPHAVQAICDQLGEIPVIFITGSPQECDPCEPPGVILEKPINHGELKAAFKRVLASCCP